MNGNQNMAKLFWNVPVLSCPEPGVNFMLDTDASNNDIGGALSQEMDGLDKVIVYLLQ